MSRLMVIGCGGVASVAVHKCCQNSGVFTELMIASRTKSKCDALKAQLEGKTDTVITTAQVDADKVEELEALIRSYKPDAVLNVALPYQDLTIMEACLRTGVDYIDTANYEAENTDDPQWRAIYEKRCKEKPPPQPFHSSSPALPKGYGFECTKICSENANETPSEGEVNGSGTLLWSTRPLLGRGIRETRT